MNGINNNNGGSNSLFNTTNRAANNLVNLEQQYQALLREGVGGANTAMSGLYNSRRTVFNDVADEWKNCTDEERKFIEQDSDYAAANVAYLQNFNAFLIDAFGAQFASSQYGASAEKLLIALKNARNKYRAAAVDDVMKMKNENAELMRKIKELEDKMNEKVTGYNNNNKGGSANGR